MLFVETPIDYRYTSVYFTYIAIPRSRYPSLYRNHIGVSRCPKHCGEVNMQNNFESRVMNKTKRFLTVDKLLTVNISLFGAVYQPYVVINRTKRVG